jgi:asparagine synthetase B (glutamine-hydrolysing)
LVIARDPLGRIPLYVVINNSGIAFASEAKLLMRPKVPFQDGAHTSFLKGYKEEMRSIFDELFVNVAG